MYVRAVDVPKGISLDPDPRTPNLRKQVYKRVKESLYDQGENQPGSFHYKHKGITMIAHSVEQAGDDRYTVTFDEGDGIVDGGHSYELILKAQGDPDLPAEQVIKFEILCGVPKDWTPDIAGGLNTSVQVQQKSLDDLAGKFDWLKAELKDEPYFDQIAWSENDEGVYDVTYLLALLACFNVEAYPNNEDKQPVVAYAKKADVLKQFERNPKQFERMRPIVKDIFKLHDIIGYESKSIYNEATKGKFARFTFVEVKKPGPYLFTGMPPEHQLLSGALFPLLGSMRWMVEIDQETDQARWQGGFESVKALWREVAAELLTQTASASQELGRDPHSLGRSRNHWSSLHSKVGLRYLQRKMVEA
ncbi:hypothetical protein A5660_25065 [Mycobacterium alsense]|nr:hypothetical protein A5660_25065 [Mycobacterium alsense]